MEWVNKYIKIPFSEHGREITGCDCWGLVKIIYDKELNIVLPALLDYKDTKDRISISSLVKQEKIQDWIEISSGQEKQFDVLIFNILNVPTHVGLVYKKGMMIHCEKGKGTYLTEYNKDHSWKKRLYGIYRHAGSTIISSTIPT